jgi:hypothetical protein
MVQQEQAMYNSQIAQDRVEMIWELDGAQGALNEARRVAPVLEQVLYVPGLRPVRYDLNQSLSWRGYDVELALIDVLTQRTQLVRIEGEEAGVGCYLATGKHGEVPTAIFLLPGEVSTGEVLAQWAQVFGKTEVQRAVLTSAAWRLRMEAMGASAPGWSLGWRGARPAGWEAPAGARVRRFGGEGWEGEEYIF